MHNLSVKNMSTQIASLWSYVRRFHIFISNQTITVLNQKDLPKSLLDLIWMFFSKHFPVREEYDILRNDRTNVDVWEIKRAECYSVRTRYTLVYKRPMVEIGRKLALLMLVRKWAAIDALIK